MLPSNVSKEMVTFGLQNSRGDKISIELTCVTAYVSRFWDWDLFCLADENGFGIKFITIRIWRENVSFLFWSFPVNFRFTGAIKRVYYTVNNINKNWFLLNLTYDFDLYVSCFHLVLVPSLLNLS